jgi:hypothetical protein
MDFPPFSERLFPLQPGRVYTGVCPDGTQVLMGLYCPEVVCFVFSPDGDLLREEARPWKMPAPEREGYWDIYDPDFKQAIARQLREWQEEIGSTPATIHVKPFFSASRAIGITDGLDMFEGNEDVLSEQELVDEAESREVWVESGYFVFYWAKDLHMDADGSVMSS